MTGERRSILSSLTSALGVALVGGLLTGCVLAVGVARASGWHFDGDVALLAVHLSGLYAACFTAGLVAVAVAEALFGRRHGARVYVGLLVGFVVFLNGVLRFNPAIQPASVVPSLNLIGIIDLLVLAIASVAAVVAIAGARHRAVAAGVAVAGLVGLQALHLWHERPLTRDLAGLDRELPRVEAPAATEASFENARVIVLGFDGLTWENLVPLLRRGELPNFRALLDGSAYGYLDTLPFAVSPVVWETMNSGRSPEFHGIGHHIHFDFAGIGQRASALPGFRLCNTVMGLRRLLAATQRFAPWSAVPSSGLDSRSARLWEIASRAGVSVGVYDWYNLGPTPPVTGFLRSLGQMKPNRFPPSLEEGLPPVPAAIEIDPRKRAPDAPLTSERERELWRRFVAAGLEFQPELLMYYTHFADGANHLNWKYERVGASFLLAGWQHPDFEPGEMIGAAHRQLDEIVGEVLQRAPAQATIVLISDHGFDFRGYEHDNSPPGVVIARGPAVEPGWIEGATVYDVAPTLLHLLGLPAAEEMPGDVLAAVGGERRERIASHGAPTPVGEVAVDAEELERQKAYLKSLGYVVD